MLETLRNAAGTWVAKILFGILVASFALWGVDDAFTGGGSNILATVGDREVTATEFDTAFRREIQRVSRQSGSAMTIDEARAIGADRQVLAQLVTRKLVEEAYTDLGMTVSDAAVAQQIRGMDSFKDDFGSFDKFRFDQIIGSAGYSEDAFIEAVRGDMTADQLINPVTAGVYLPDGTARAIFANRSEERQVRYVSLQPDTISITEPTEAQLRATYEAHPARYMAPELRRISYLHLTVKELSRGISIPEEELRAAYDDQIDEFTKEEERGFNRLVVSDDAIVEQIMTRAKNGENLIALGQELLQLDEGDIVNGATAKADLPADQADALFALPHNGVSEPIDSAFGKVIMQVTAIYSGSTQSFDQVKTQLKDQLAEDLALDQLYALVDEIEDLRAGGSSLKEIATAKSLPIETTAPTSAAGRDIDGGPVNGLPADPAFLESAFALSSGETGDMIETSSGDYLLLHVDEVNEKALRPFDEVENLVAFHSKREAQLKAAQAAAQALKEAAGQLGSLTEAAKAKGYDLQTADRVTRASTGSTFSSEMLSAIFDADKGDVLVGANAGTPMIVELANVKSTTASDQMETYKFVRAQIAQGLGTDLSNLYQVALEKDYGVEIYQHALQRLYTSADEQ